MRSWIAVLFVTGACSSPFPSDDIAIIDASPFFDSTIPKEASTFDVVDKDTTPFNGGGPFECIDCICDGTLNYCVYSSGGKAPIVDASADGSDDASSDAGLETCGETSTCTAIPIECLPKPTCDCVMKKYTSPCTCDVDPSGNGLVVTCVYP